MPSVHVCARVFVQVSGTALACHQMPATVPVPQDVSFKTEQIPDVKSELFSVCLTGSFTLLSLFLRECARALSPSLPPSVLERAPLLFVRTCERATHSATLGCRKANREINHCCAKPD